MASPVTQNIAASAAQTVPTRVVASSHSQAQAASKEVVQEVVQRDAVKLSISPRNSEGSAARPVAEAGKQKTSPTYGPAQRKPNVPQKKR